MGLLYDVIPGSNTKKWKKGPLALVGGLTLLVIIIIATTTGGEATEAAEVAEEEEEILGDSFKYSRGKFLTTDPDITYNTSSDQPTCEAACVADKTCTGYMWGDEDKGEALQPKKHCFGYRTPFDQLVWRTGQRAGQWGVGQRLRV